MYSGRQKKPFTAILALMRLLAVVVLFSSRAHAAQSVIILDREPCQELSGHFDHYDDPSGKLMLADILEQKHAIGFTPLKGNLNDGYSHKAVWLRFTMRRTSSFPANFWLRLYPPDIDNITVCVQSGDDPAQASSYRQIQIGDHIPVAERPIMNTDFLIPLLLPEERPVTVYLRVQSSSSLTLAGSLHSPNDMIRQTNSNTLLQGGYFTITIVIALLNLIFFLRIGDKLFLYFTLYVCSLFINYLSISGIFSIILPGIAHLISDYPAILGKGGGILLFSFFLKRLFAKELTPLVRRYLDFTALVGGLTILAYPLGFYTEMAPITSMSVFPLFFLITWTSYKAVKKEISGSMLFFVAFGISNLIYFLHFLKLIGWVSLEGWNINNVHVASLFNMILMTLALIEHLRESEKLAVSALRESDMRGLWLSIKLEIERMSTQRQKRFLTMISHEYRTPLAIIRSSLDIMELQKSDQFPGNLAELEKIKRAVKRLVEMMDLSLHKSRLSDSEENEGKRRTLVEPLIVSELAEIRILWPKRSLTYTSSLNSHEILVEPHYFHIALFNIVDNALKYSPPDSPVEVDCHEESDFVIIRVHNRCDGIIKNEHEQLFNKYKRGSNSNNTAGSGIGLWLVRSIIEQYNGHVTLESDDHSVTVTLRLPLSHTLDEQPT